MVLHVVNDWGQPHPWEVWLDPDEDGKFVGLCVGVGSTKDEALASAVEGLEEMVESIQRGVYSV